MSRGTCLLLTIAVTVPLIAAMGCQSRRTEVCPRMKVCPAQERNRCEFWIDLYRGEPVQFDEMIEDLAESRVIYLGETHTLDRHHAIQEQIVRELVKRDVELAVAMEQLEFVHQNTLDQYSAGEIDFETLAEKINWGKVWNNYLDYRGVVEAAHEAGAPIVGLNARSATIRAIGREGIEGLDEEMRAELPEEMVFDDPMYVKHLNKQMMVHATMDESFMDRVTKAQMARDETMADRLVKFLQSPEGRDRVVVVILGAGHVSHGLGTPDRVRRRMPGVRDRIIVMTESGDMELTPFMKKMARAIVITHEDLRHLQRPLADYLHARNYNPVKLAEEEKTKTAK